MKKIILAGIFGLTLSGMLFTSCKKDKEVDSETQSVQDNAICEQEFSRIMPEVQGRGINQAGLKKLMSGGIQDSMTGDTIFSDGIDPQNLPTLWIKYGPGGSGTTLTTDGKARSGIIKATFSKPIDSVGCVTTVTFMNYKVNNSIAYNATIVYTKLANGYSTNIQNGTCVAPAWSATWQGSRTMTQIAGVATTTDETDDVYQFTGSSSGVNREGRAYTVAVTTPLEKPHNWKWITKGVVELTPEGLHTRTVDFGNGTLDDKATFTVDGNSVEFTMQ